MFFIYICDAKNFMSYFGGSDNEQVRQDIVASRLQYKGSNFSVKNIDML